MTTIFSICLTDVPAPVLDLIRGLFAALRAFVTIQEIEERCEFSETQEGSDE